MLSKHTAAQRRQFESFVAAATWVHARSTSIHLTESHQATQCCCAYTCRPAPRHCDCMQASCSGRLHLHVPHSPLNYHRATSPYLHVTPQIQRSCLCFYASIPIPGGGNEPRCVISSTHSRGREHHISDQVSSTHHASTNHLSLSSWPHRISSSSMPALVPLQPPQHRPWTGSARCDEPAPAHWLAGMGT